MMLTLGEVRRLGVSLATVCRIWRLRAGASTAAPCRPGDLFFALRGPNHDGHGYVQAALEAGAVAAVVDRGWTAWTDCCWCRIRWRRCKRWRRGRGRDGAGRWSA